MTSDTGVPRRLRRDAERNRSRILDAARAVFAERGLDARLDHIAERAGVGVGTLYRRFPGKAQLVEALFEERIVQLADLVEAAAERQDAGPAFVDVMAGLIERNCVDRGMGDVVFGAASDNAAIRRSTDRLHGAITRLLRRAQDEGAVRPDLRATDVPVLVLALTGVAEFGRVVDPGLWRRYLPMVLDALGAEPRRSVLEHPALGATQLDAALDVHHRRAQLEVDQIPPSTASVDPVT